jgi:uncharacterized coiled-coil DUF342 family protein
VANAVNERELRGHLDEVHRQMLERDNAYRFHDEELRSRDLQIEQLHAQVEQLRKQLTDMRAWAQELEASIWEMQEPRAWRLVVRLRSARAGAKRLVGK